MESVYGDRNHESKEELLCIPQTFFPFESPQGAEIGCSEMLSRQLPRERSPQQRYVDQAFSRMAQRDAQISPSVAPLGLQGLLQSAVQMSTTRSTHKSLLQNR